MVSTQGATPFSGRKASAIVPGTVVRPVKLFIGGLTPNTTTKQLRDHFSQYGRILDCVAMRQPDGRPRGFGYVTLDSPAAADLCLAEPQVVDGRVLDMKRAVPGSSGCLGGAEDSPSGFHAGAPAATPSPSHSAAWAAAAAGLAGSPFFPLGSWEASFFGATPTPAQVVAAQAALSSHAAAAWAAAWAAAIPQPGMEALDCLEMLRRSSSTSTTIASTSPLSSSTASDTALVGSGAVCESMGMLTGGFNGANRHHSLVRRPAPGLDLVALDTPTASPSVSLMTPVSRLGARASGLASATSADFLPRNGSLFGDEETPEKMALPTNLCGNRRSVLGEITNTVQPDMSPLKAPLPTSMIAGRMTSCTETLGSALQRSSRPSRPQGARGQATISILEDAPECDAELVESTSDFAKENGVGVHYASASSTPSGFKSPLGLSPPSHVSKVVRQLSEASMASMLLAAGPLIPGRVETGALPTTPVGALQKVAMGTQTEVDLCEHCSGEGTECSESR
mmetsp:Transcript_151200/g.483842  ORF Transcript_151200/g.483842 Transcript_151200/m.483842 type:complete len:510 (+) Transcript_151200:79-1608(+)